MNGDLTIEYKDNGKGLGPDDLKKNTLGLDLINSLVQQLEGHLQFIQGSGFHVQIRFKVGKIK